jgi:hypothetical protein
MDEWIAFSGKATKVANYYRLVGDKGGELEAGIEAVREINGKFSVRKGSKMKVSVAPSGSNKSPSPPDAEMKAMGDCDHTACIGLVEVCCGSGKVLRACIGVWSCP